jgi:hypothetical protein
LIDFLEKKWSRMGLEKMHPKPQNNHPTEPELFQQNDKGRVPLGLICWANRIVGSQVAGRAMAKRQMSNVK